MEIKPPAPDSTVISDCEALQLDELVKRFQHRVGFFARRIQLRFGLDPQCLDDLSSAGYWGLFKALRNRRPDAHEQELSAYVSQRVEGAVIDEARRVLTQLSNRADCDLGDLETSPRTVAVGLDWGQGISLPGPEDLADRSGRWRTIEAAVEHLGSEHLALLWSYAEGRSISEIARSDGQSVSRLQSQLTRISRQIRARSPELRRLLRHEI